MLVTYTRIVSALIAHRLMVETNIHDRITQVTVHLLLGELSRRGDSSVRTHDGGISW